jgi:hypothetical protein
VPTAVEQCGQTRFVWSTNEDAMPNPAPRVLQDNGDFQRIHAAFARLGDKLALRWGYGNFR